MAHGGCRALESDDDRRLACPVRPRRLVETDRPRVAAAGVHETWAEYFLAPAKSLVPLPEAIPDEAAAQLIAFVSGKG